MKTILESLKERYGFSKTSQKWIAIEGASILEYIGVDVVAIEFTKKSDNDWTTVLKKACIREISDFDPMTVTYLCKYQIIGEDEGESWREVRIIPEGYSMMGDDSSWMIRFIPYSVHCKMAETEAFYVRLFEVQAKSSGLSVESMGTISDSKSQDATLGYSCNIGAVIKTTDNEILWFRIKKLNIRHKFKQTYTLSITSWDDKNYVFEINSSDTEHDFIVNKEMIGKFKIIDLRG